MRYWGGGQGDLQRGPLQASQLPQATQLKDVCLLTKDVRRYLTKSCSCQNSRLSNTKLFALHTH